MIPTLLTTFLFALTAVCATQAAIAFGGTRANFGRLLIAVILLGIWAHTYGFGWGGGQFGRLYLAGAVGFGLGGLCMFQAFPLIGSTLSLLVVECAAAVSTGILAWWALGAALTPLQMVCGLVSIAGVLIGLAPYRLPDVPRGALIAGALFATVASIGQGISWTLTKSAFMRIRANGEDLDALTAAYQRLLGGMTVALVAMVVLWLIQRLRKEDGIGRTLVYTNSKRVSVWSALWVLANALTGPVLGVGCMLWAIRVTENPGVVQAVVATATLVSVPFARRLEGRSLKQNYYSGATMSILGTAGLLIFSR